MFTFTKIYTDAQGEVHFEELTEHVIDQKPIEYLYRNFPVEHLVFQETPPDYRMDLTHISGRQFFILLDGELEIETSVGEKRSFHDGDILWLEDIHEHQLVSWHNISPKQNSVLISLR